MIQKPLPSLECWYCKSTATIGKEVRHQQFLACTNCGATIVEKLPIVERPKVGGRGVFVVQHNGKERQMYSDGRYFWENKH